MTQVVSVLTMFFFLWLKHSIFIVTVEGELMGKTNIPEQELRLKMGGGLMHERRYMGGMTIYPTCPCFHGNC